MTHGLLARTALEACYRGKRVFLTGHTGFKGSWLTLWLEWLGARVYGYSLAPETPSLFEAAGVAASCHHVEGDILDAPALARAFGEAQPDIVFHLAAQSLVRRSYAQPLQTVATNVLGTAQVLEAVRQSSRRCAVLVVSSDKCYENREWVHGYRESDALGGRDVYSMSKGATELVAASWRASFFPPDVLERHGVALATARAGNVIGGGDWAEDRIIPDCIRALVAGVPIRVRNPSAIRPWQHVLEPLGGYLQLGAYLLGHGRRTPQASCGAWNFGPGVESTRTVGALATQLVAEWGSGSWSHEGEAGAPHEAQLLRLSIDKAWAELDWAPRWDFNEAIRATAEWYKAAAQGADQSALRRLTLEQIERYQG